VNEHLDASRDMAQRSHDAMNCMFDHGHALGESVGAGDYAVGIVDERHLPGDFRERFNEAYVQCDVGHSFEYGTPFHVPALEYPGLAGLQVALTSTVANAGENEFFESQQQFGLGFDQGYHDGGIAMFDKSLENVFAHDTGHTASDQHTEDLGGRSDLAAAIDAAFAPASQGGDHSSSSGPTTDTSGSGSSSSTASDSGSSSSSSASSSSSGGI
jgi:hypothetical protein